MFSLPEDYEQSWTLASSVKRKGVGLHTGELSTVQLKPFDQPGFYLSWKDSPNPPFELNPTQVLHTPLCTTLELGSRRLATVEHLFGALAGCGITHVHIEVSGNEIPLLDGSAKEWVDAIEEAGISNASSLRKPIPIVKEPIVKTRGNSAITAIPSERFKLIGIIDFSYPVIDKQIFSIELTPQVFIEEIAPARTFGFKDQLEDLKNSGLIKGGSLENALVCDGENWINPPLRFPDEPIRHKLLDLIGDLSLVGFPKAQILVYRGSHGLHADLASDLFKASNSH